jgi:hypothetical protein
MAEQLAPVLKEECWAEVLSGKLKGRVVRVARQDDEQPGFWWCVWPERGKPPKERMLSANQLKALGQAP